MMGRPEVTLIMLNSRTVLDTQTSNIIWPENLLATLRAATSR